MFTADQIKTEHAKVKSGADFPGYIRTLRSLGVNHYDYLVADGSCTFYGQDGSEATWHPKYTGIAIAAVGSNEKLSHAIAIHQQGKTDFMTFVRQAADAGVAVWTTDLEKMVVIYKDGSGGTLLAEPIPHGEYA
jgi:uncharacterized protein YbcV (DUF1398 family)